ncbi:MAG TPA: phosphopantothenate/pantothenate synthetase [Candidatus Lokiarchaeia archaeon]|nr:phosphopantothenate/pantothenate synthetase [Candidatus Lokiarchaeia archaeon]
MSEHIPASHPRAESLRVRQKIIEGMENKVVTKAGLFAHGRGEAFDYLMGERTIPAALEAMDVAVAMLLLATHPVLSINGNTAALVPEAIVQLGTAVNAKLEVNLFYREPGREEAVAQVLTDAGATEILGLGDVPTTTLEHLESDRRIIDPRGIAIADVVMVPLEDGDRTEALRKAGKKIIAIDLNPLSRTAQWAHVTICDNITRCVPKMVEIAEDFKQNKTQEELENIVANHDNARVLSNAIKEIIDYLSPIAEKGVFLELPEPTE